MKYQCPQCKALLKINEGKISSIPVDKDVKGRCPKCGHAFLIKKTSGPPPPIGSNGSRQQGMNEDASGTTTPDVKKSTANERGEKGEQIEEKLRTAASRIEALLIMAKSKAKKKYKDYKFKEAAEELKEYRGYIKADFYRLKNEKIVLYTTTGVLAFIMFILLGISAWLFIVLILVSIISVKFQQGKLLGQCFKISKKIRPDIYGLAEVAAKRLDMDEIPDIFVKQDPFINAYAIGFIGKKSIVINSGTIDGLNNDELTAIFGHELSHIKCGHTSWLVVTNSAEGIKIPIISQCMGLLFLKWSRIAEFTCDRGALIGSNNLEASLSALCKVAMGSNIFEDMLVDVFGEQKKQIEDDLISKIAQIFETHPYVFNRLNAIKDFSESRIYREIKTKFG